MLIYLGVSALIAFAAAFVFHILGILPALAVIHLVLAIGVLPLIIGAIAHFVPVLTRGDGAPYQVTLLPVLCQLAGALVFAFFSGYAGVGALHAAASATFLVVTGFGAWLVLRAQCTLGKPHPGWRWYLVAVAFLAMGLLLVPCMSIWPAMRPELRLLHIHLNVLGFVGLAAVGTLQVLLPTVLSGPDAAAASRLRRDLLPAAVGALLTAIGAAFWHPLSVIGAGLLLYVGGRVGLAWWRCYGVTRMLADGASMALVVALSGFMLLVVFGVLHAQRIVGGHDAVPGFFSLFLLPLVTGALSQLLPVWRFPGRHSVARERMRAVLVNAAAIRVLLFVCGGMLLVVGNAIGLWLTAFGLLQFLLAVARSFLPDLAERSV